MDISDALVTNFSNGETRVEIKNSCRGCDCYVIQPICNTEDGVKSVNDTLMELLIMIAALRGSSAERITAVMPIYGYARQDKKDKSRAAISARLVADLLEAAGCDRVMTVDLHASQIQGFFSKPMDNLYAEDLLTSHMTQQFQRLASAAELVVVSPDAGGAKRASRVACKLGSLVDCAIISKERLKANEVASMRLVGSVKDRIAIIVDDMADTCGTLTLAVETVKAAGALEVHAYVVHGVLSGPAIKRINECKDLTSVVVTNTVPQDANLKRCPKLQVIDISSLLATAIACTHSNNSISALFKSPFIKPTKGKNKDVEDNFSLDS
jgi:ribose-phosphate pyrophosphokinase